MPSRHGGSCTSGYDGVYAVDRTVVLGAHRQLVGVDVLETVMLFRVVT